jgi:hypothetical protein
MFPENVDAVKRTVRKPHKTSIAAILNDAKFDNEIYMTGYTQC